MEPLTTTATAGPYTKADPVKRFLAVFIDGLIGGVAYSVMGIFGVRGAGLGMLIAAAYLLVRDGLALDFADGRSIGKKLMKLRPVRLDGGAMTIEASVRRNWPLALSYLIYGLSWLLGGWTGLLFLGTLGMIASLLWFVEGILVLTDKDGRRFGDKFANTQVIVTEA